MGVDEWCCVLMGVTDVVIEGVYNKLQPCMRPI